MGEQRLQRDVEDKWQQDVEDWQRMEEERWKEKKNRRREKGWRKRRREERRLPMEERWQRALDRRQRMEEERQQELERWQWIEKMWGQQLEDKRRRSEEVRRQREKERQLPMEEWWPWELERRKPMEKEWQQELELWHWMEEKWAQRMMYMRRRRIEEERQQEVEERWMPMEERRQRKLERLQRMEEERRGELELWQRMEERMRQRMEEEKRQRVEEEKRHRMEEERRRKLRLEEERRQRKEERQQREEERQQQMERFRRRWVSEPDLVRQIEEMAVDSADVESIESALVNEDTVQLSLEQELKRKRDQQQLAVQENLRENERRLRVGKLLLPELEREKELDRLAGVEEWREWEEEWRNLQWEQEGMELESFKPAPAAQESLLTEDVMGELASTESVVVNEDTEEQQPLIGGMEADSTDVASIIFPNHTEVLFSLGREQEPRQELGSFPQAPGARVDLDWIFVITNFILELASAVFDQLSSVRKPQFALLGMLMSYAALFICIVELVYKCRKEKVTWKWRGRLPWLYYPSQKPFGRFDDIIGLVCAICQCVVATIAYSFCLRHADNPIKISIWPIIFASGLLCAKLLRDRRERERERGSTNRLPVSIEDIHYH